MNPLNRSAAERIVDLFADDPPVLFVGAGLSIPPYESWAELLIFLQKKLELPSAPTSEDPLDRAQEICAHNPEGFKKALLEKFLPMPEECNNSLMDILSITKRAIVTTNFDRTLELALDKANLLPLPVASKDFTVSDCQYPSIYYIHGWISEDPNANPNVILTKSSYREAYIQKRNVSIFLYDLFRTHKILFTGHSIAKGEVLPLILESVNESIRRHRERLGQDVPQKHWAILLPEGEANEANARRLSDLRIEIIRYDPINLEYKGLNEVWNQIHIKLKGMHPRVKMTPFAPLAPLDEGMA